MCNFTTFAVYRDICLKSAAYGVNDKWTDKIIVECKCEDEIEIRVSTNVMEIIAENYLKILGDEIFVTRKVCGVIRN